MMIKRISLLLYLTLLLQIFAGTALSGQTGLITELNEKFNRYIAGNPWEEVYLHTDRKYYVSGEEIWFAAYLVDRETGKPSELSSITYVELLNSSNVPLVQKRIYTPGGFGPGEIMIPDTISTGKYILRAYTNWMKNFFPVNCFIKEINIYNPLKPTDQLSGTGVSYRMNIDSSMPRKQENSWNIDVSMDEENITFSVNSGAVTSEADGNSCVIFIHTHGIINYSGNLTLNNGSATLILSREKLINGINHITLFTSQGTPVAEKYIYTPSDDVSSTEVNAPERSGKREKISVELNHLLPSGLSTDSAFISVAVILAVGSDTLADLADYMVFGSEFGAGQQINPGNLLPEKLDSILDEMSSHWIDWNIILSDKRVNRGYPAEKEGHTISGRLLRKDTHVAVPDHVLFLSSPGKKATFQYSRTGINGSFSYRVPLTRKVSDIIIQPEAPDSDISLEFETPFTKDYRTHTFIISEEKMKIPDYIQRWGANVQVGKIYGSRFSAESGKIIDYQPEMKRFYGKPDIELKLDDYIKLPVMQEVFFELLQGVTLRERKSGYEVIILDPVEIRPYLKPPVLMVDGVVIHDPAIIAGIDPEFVEQIDVVKEIYIVGDYIIYGLVNVITRSGDFGRFSLPDYAVRLRFRTIDPVNTFWSPDYSGEAERSNRLPDFRNTLYWNGSVKSISKGKTGIEFWSSDYAGEYEIIIQGITTGGFPISARKRIRIN